MGERLLITDYPLPVTHYPVLARARGLQERIRPIRLVSREEVGNVCAVEGDGYSRPAPEKSSWSGTGRIAPASKPHSFTPPSGEGDIDLPLLSN